MSRIAPAPTLDFTITPEQVASIIRDAIEKELAVNDTIAALKPEEQSYETIVRPLAHIENTMSDRILLVNLLSQVSPDAAVREAAVEAERVYEEFSIEQSMRHDLYVSIHDFINKTDLSGFEHEDARLLKHMERGFRRNGLHLSSEKCDHLKQLRKRLSEVTIEYNKNWSRENSSLLFTKEELTGLDDDFIGGLTTKEMDGVKKYVLTMKYPDYIPLMRLCKNENTRKTHMTAYESRSHENIVLLEEAVKIRRQCAKILGYESHAAFILDVKMAKTVGAVRNFVDDLATRLKDAGIREFNVLKEIKKKEKAENHEEYDGKINAWDTSYYKRILLEKHYSVDQEKIKKYFVLEATIQKMLDIYEKVLGLKFNKVSKDKAVVWHEDVQIFECWDDAEDKSFMGYMYLDLFPRDSKYPHAACFPVEPAYMKEDGTYVPSIAAMVANFTKPTKDKPSLLKHEEVVTLFHELGHVMHHICSRTKYSRFHGTTVEGDFVEAPSQMLENWCYDATSLKYLSAHFETGEPLSDDTIELIIKSKNVNAAIDNLRQLFFGIFDMDIHTSDDEHLDTTKLYNELGEKICFIAAPEGSFGQASFGHVMGGYDAGYYGYMWSKVFSSDMYFSKFVGHTLSREVGYAYRKEILEKGSSVDGMEMLKRFLNREPSSEAFMREEIGIN
ncbi:hypothetical protein BDF14DRAFT_1768860 [Spinellus fusiger]|nr:hypothetical protein BDF14DRAFT_1768860 [Spinellus fusiger]